MVSEWTGKHVTYLKIVHGFQKSTVTDSTALDMKLTLEIQFYFYFNYDFWYYILKQKIRSSSVSDLVVFQLCCLFGPMYCFEVKEYIFLLNNNVVISWNVVFFKHLNTFFGGKYSFSQTKTWKWIQVVPPPEYKPLESTQGGLACSTQPAGGSSAFSP